MNEEEQNKNDFEGSKYNFIVGIAWLGFAMIIFSAQGSFYLLLNDYDSTTFSACNVLCVSSIYAIVYNIFYFFHWSKITKWSHVMEVPREKWACLFFGSMLYSVLGPYFFFIGLQTTDIPVASIMQRLEPTLFVILSTMFLDTKLNTWCTINLLITCVGVIVAITFDSMAYGEDVDFPTGYLFILLSVCCYSLSLLISKKYLVEVNVGVLSSFRITVGAIMFHALSVLEGNQDTLTDPILWMYMLPYGFIFMFSGQLSWLTALEANPPITLSIGSNFKFVLTLLFGIAINNQIPNVGQAVASSIIFIGIVSGVAEIILSEKKSQDNAYEKLIKTDKYYASNSSDLEEDQGEGDDDNDHRDCG